MPPSTKHERLRIGVLGCGPIAQVECKALIRAVSGRPVTLELIQDTAEQFQIVKMTNGIQLKKNIRIITATECRQMAIMNIKWSLNLLKE